MTRVLLVEDSADVLYVMQIDLEWRGFVVDTAISGVDALVISNQHPPDVIVSDLGMPMMDGFEFIRRVRRTPDLKSIPAIALTGASMDWEIQQAISDGFTTHLMKPVATEHLAEMIWRLTARHLERSAS